MLITLYAKRNGSDVNIYDENNKHKATFTNQGYRPTKATKTIIFNCWMFNLKWI